MADVNGSDIPHTNGNTVVGVFPAAVEPLRCAESHLTAQQRGETKGTKA